MSMPHFPQNIAHRGARSLAPENTISAARQALENGADMWELDVTLTADGELIVLHDESLKRTTNVASIYPDRAPWKAHTFLLNEIRELDAGSWFVDQDPFGQIRSGAVNEEECQSYIGEKIPTLEDALRFTRDKDWRVNVEIKDAGNGPGSGIIVERVLYMIRKLDMTERVLISSFNHNYLIRSKQTAPEVDTAALVAMPAMFASRKLKQMHAQAYHPRKGAISPYRIKALQERGFSVNVWTVNEDHDMARYVDWGVDGLITDFPQRLQAMK
jgi:glycerophosphoryl diester phosphodiesterase